MATTASLESVEKEMQKQNEEVEKAKELVVQYIMMLHLSICYVVI